MSKPAIARGIGEILQPIKNFPSYWYVVVSPNLMVSTAWAYKEYGLQLTNSKKRNILNTIGEVRLNIPDMLSNDLEQVTLKKYPFLCSIKVSLLQLGALGALMSGSGPSLFGLFDSGEKAREACNILKSRERGDVFVAKSLG